MSRLLARADVRHAVIEGDNLDLAYPVPWQQGLKLAELNLAAMWRNYCEAGYRRLVFTNTVSVLEIDSLSAALGGEVRAIGVLLTADDETVRSRLTAREIGSALDEHLERSAATARRLDAQAPNAVHRVRTDDRTVADIANEIVALTGWLGPS
ncbi:adenylyl-sulfate kinase [Gryllotalpicola daejeonensis]|uniref:adenylyl-sulfate kinase n=1 Tax=Gryllotalpicola daejeonensis TaxID=993087 RepID=UPI0031D9F4D9